MLYPLTILISLCLLCRLCRPMPTYKRVSVPKCADVWCCTGGTLACPVSVLWNEKGIEYYYASKQITSRFWTFRYCEYYDYYMYLSMCWFVNFKCKSIIMRSRFACKSGLFMTIVFICILQEYCGWGSEMVLYVSSRSIRSFVCWSGKGIYQAAN